MIVIAVLLGLLIGLFLSIRIYLVSRKSGNTTSQSHAILSGAMILGVGVLLFAYFLLKGEGWTEDKRVEFYQIGAIALMLAFVIFGVRLILSGRKQKSLLTQIMGAGWTIGAMVVGINSYNIAGTINDGWSKEKRAKVAAKCDPSTQNCQCYEKQTILFFKSVEDYTETLSNESDNQDRINEYYQIIEDSCACGVQSTGVEEVDLPF